MLKKFFDWTKNNKFATLVIFVLLLALFYLLRPRYVSSSPLNKVMMGAGAGGVATDYVAPAEQGSPTLLYPRPGSQPAPTLSVKDRKVITEASLSLQVKNVGDSINEVKAKVAELNGYVVNVFLNRPEFGENATISVRVPSDKVEEFLAYTKGRAVKVVNETVSGSDITDQYVDTATRLGQLEEQMAMLESILRSAHTVDEIMQVQPYITDIQNQIDNLKGQNNYVDEASKSSLITMYLSTDELSLPYTPEQSWRPEVVFKNATRSLLLNLQKAGSGLIWLGVYSVIIVPALTIILIIYLVKKRKHS